MATLGMSKKEIKDYSLVRAIRAAAENNWGNAGIEAEAAKELYKTGRFNPGLPHSFPVPLEVLSEPIALTRDLTAASGSGGGYLVSGGNVSFIELLRNRSVLMTLGAERLTGMVGNFTIPRQVSSATSYWQATEANALTESQPIFGQLSFSPKTAGAYTEVSRQLMLQSSPSVEALVRKDLAETVALSVDAAGLTGTGASGQPLGILNVSGIGSVTGASIDYAKVLEFQSDVAAGNALAPGCAYACPPAIATLLKQRQRFSSTDSPLWSGNIYEGSVEGFRSMSTNQIPTGTLVFGDWAQVIIAEWGELEVMVNPYTNFQAGIYGVRCFYTIDVGLRYPGAFSVATSVN